MNRNLQRASQEGAEASRALSGVATGADTMAESGTASREPTWARDACGSPKRGGLSPAKSVQGCCSQSQEAPMVVDSNADEYTRDEDEANGEYVSATATVASTRKNSRFASVAVQDSFEEIDEAERLENSATYSGRSRRSVVRGSKRVISPRKLTTRESSVLPLVVDGRLSLLSPSDSAFVEAHGEPTGSARDVDRTDDAGVARGGGQSIDTAR